MVTGGFLRNQLTPRLGSGGRKKSNFLGIGVPPVVPPEPPQDTTDDPFAAIRQFIQPEPEVSPVSDVATAALDLRSIGRIIRTTRYDQLHGAGIPIEKYEALTDIERGELREHGERVITKKLPTGQRVALVEGEPKSFIERINLETTGLASTDVTIGSVTMKAGEWAGLFGITVAVGTAVIASLPIVFTALMTGAFLRNINKLSLQVPSKTPSGEIVKGTPIDPKIARDVAGWLARQVKPTFANSAKAIKEILKPTGTGKFVPTSQAIAKADAYTNSIVKRILPEFSATRTDAVIAGIQSGKYSDIIPPSVQAVRGVVGQIEPEVPVGGNAFIIGQAETAAEKLPVPTDLVVNPRSAKVLEGLIDRGENLFHGTGATDIGTFVDDEGNLILSAGGLEVSPTGQALSGEFPEFAVSFSQVLGVAKEFGTARQFEINPKALETTNVERRAQEEFNVVLKENESLVIPKGSWSIVGEPTPTALQPAVTPPEAVSEKVAVTEVTGVPPPKKPPKNWDKIGGELYDRFKKQSSAPTPNTVPLTGRRLRAQKVTEKVVADEFAKLNALGWQAELDVALVRASGGQAGQLYHETMKAVTKSIGGDSNLLSYVDDYLMLRHQLEVLKATGRKYFTIKKEGKSQRFTAPQIGLLFDQMKKELGVETYAKVKEAASHIPAIYNQILKGTQELTSGQIDGLIKKYPWYNPILFKNDTVPANITRKLSPRQVRELTTLEADKENISPLLSLPTTIAKRLKAQAVNDARKSIAELAVDPKNTRLIGGEVEIVTKKPIGASIDYFENGERKYLKLGKGSEWMAQDIEMLQRQPPHVVITLVIALQNLTKMFLTTYNPGFVAYNTLFDAAVSYFSEGVTAWGFGKTLAGNIKGVFADVPSIDQFRQAGGELFGFFEKASLKRGIGEEVEITPYVTKKGGRLVLKNPRSLKRFINPFELIRELGIAGENAGRRATFEKAIKEGVSQKEASLRGRRVTVDFTRFSTASRHINTWFIYFNPAMQGLLLPARAIARSPRSLWRLAALISAYAALTFYNQSYDEYDDVRDSDKVGKLLIMLPSDEYNKFGQKVPHYLTMLPLREFAAFTAPIEYFMGKLRTEEPEAYRTLGQEWGVLYPILTPLSMISESGGLVMPTQIGATIQQIVQNHDDFRDRPIVDDEMELLPTVEQYDQWTNTMAIRVGQALNMSPKMLDFFISNMFGALGQDGLRAIDQAIRVFDREDVDERIAGLVDELRTIQTVIPPNQIAVARETFLEGLSVEDRQLVLNMERLPEKHFPFFQSMVRRFFKDYGGQVFATAKEKALAIRTLDDYPPEALEELQNAALENTNNFLAGKITKQQFDKSATRYRAYYSGAATAEWRQGMIEGAVARADVDKFLPEAYQRSEEFQAVSAYMELREKYIDIAGGIFDSETWDSIETQTLAELKLHYSERAVQYAIEHKDDWIDRMPEPARSFHRDRAVAMEDDTWWDDYRGVVPFTPPLSRKDPFGRTRTSPFDQRQDSRPGKLIFK